MLFTPADHINCIHMPIAGFLCYPEGQLKQQLCNIGFGRSSRLKGESHYMGFVERASELSCVQSEREQQIRIQDLRVMVFSQHMCEGGGCTEGRRSSLRPNCCILDKAIKLILQHSSVMWPRVIPGLIGTTFV